MEGKTKYHFPCARHGRANNLSLRCCRVSGTVQQAQLEAAWTSIKWALQRAEIAGCHPSATQYIRDALTGRLQEGPEAIAYAAVRACIDSEAALIITISQTGKWHNNAASLQMAAWLTTTQLPMELLLCPRPF